jgi:uncharacterized protein
VDGRPRRAPEGHPNVRIVVDADSCPVKGEILEAAGRHRADVVMVASLSHQIDCRGLARVIQVDNEAERADLVIINTVRAGDIVVTGDHGLASLVSMRGGRALSPRGAIYREREMDSLLASRHTARRARRGRGARVHGPGAFTNDDRRAFIEALEKALGEAGQP